MLHPQVVLSASYSCFLVCPSLIDDIVALQHRYCHPVLSLLRAPGRLEDFIPSYGLPLSSNSPSVSRSLSSLCGAVPRVPRCVCERTPIKGIA